MNGEREPGKKAERKLKEKRKWQQAFPTITLKVYFPIA
jgi:hypothetical protein